MIPRLIWRSGPVARGTGARRRGADSRALENASVYTSQGGEGGGGDSLVPRAFWADGG